VDPPRTGITVAFPHLFVLYTRSFRFPFRVPHQNANGRGEMGESVCPFRPTFNGAEAALLLDKGRSCSRSLSVETRVGAPGNLCAYNTVP